jgi:hypothetical protein
MRRLVTNFLLGIAAAVTALGQPPTRKLDNGIIHATLYLPDPAKGFYRGTRFDWSGVIADLTYAGHTYYGEWFTKRVPDTRDFIFDGSEIIAGTCSAITGPAESFIRDDGTPLGFTNAQPGQTFVKIGIGVLRRPSAEKYSGYHQYEIVDPGDWRVRSKPNMVEFTQKIEDERSGYGYLYTKTLRLTPGEPVLTMRHSLKNLGRLPIVSDVFNHNFLVLDHQTTGPDFTIRLPFPIEPIKPIKRDLGEIDGSTISYRKQLEGKETFTVQIGGFDKTARDYDIRIENSRLKAGMRITGDQPLEQEELWSIRSTIAVEPFLHISIAPGQTYRWSYTYRFYTLP